MRTIPVWYIPSFHGDIRLMRTAPGKTKVLAERLTPTERGAMEKLKRVALKKGWSMRAVWGHVVDLKAPIDRVAGVLARAMKPGKKLVTAVTFADGFIEEIREAEYVDAEVVETAPPFTLTPSPPSTPPSPTPSPPSTPRVVTAAVTVAAPARGCPWPDFMAAELRARNVLDVFLSEDQRADFRAYNRFVSVGAETGHRYMITSRHANDELRARRGVLYDLEEERPICAHDWDVPAAEEMLGLHLFLQFPGRESWLRNPIDFSEVIADEVIEEGVRAAVNRMVLEGEQ